MSLNNMKKKIQKNFGDLVGKLKFFPYIWGTLLL